MSAVDLAYAIRRRRLSAREVVDAHIARIEEADGALGAVVGRAFERARREAEEADRAIARAGAQDALPPLLGVPCTIKEFLAVEGLSNTAGLAARRGVVAGADAEVVARLRRAGAIVLGVTNVPEGGLWMETANTVYGRTNNPWDRARTPGGSSGGEAAIIAAGGSPFGIGSDIAGSIRIPSAFCGIAGHKPTGGLVPNTGHWGAQESATSALVCGPMARSARDLAPILRIIAGPDGRDPVATRSLSPGSARPLVPGETDVIPIEGFGTARIREPARSALRGAADRLADRGYRVGPGPARRVRDALSIWMSAMRAMARDRGVRFAEVLGGGEPVRVGPELARAAVGRSAYTLPALALAALDEVTSAVVSRVGIEESGPGRVSALAAELENELGDRGVFLAPPYPRPAPLHRAGLLAPFEFVGTGLFNLLGFPAAQVPVGTDAATGLPVGVQIASGRGNDELVLRVAETIEDAVGGYRGPVDIDRARRRGRARSSTPRLWPKGPLSTRRGAERFR